MASAMMDRTMPTPTPGFESLARSWDTSFDQCMTKILPGEYYVTRNQEGITTVLGSCVSACIRDPNTGVGGMNHFMLPGSSGRPMNQWGGEEALETRYGIAAMEQLINSIMKLGARKAQLEVKLFGGGHVLDMAVADVGARNIKFAEDFIRTEGLAVASQDLGGPYPRKVHYFPRTGKVLVRRMRAMHASGVAATEKRYEASLKTPQQDSGDIELFD